VSRQEVLVGHVHVLVMVVLQALHPTACLILNQHAHQLILCCQ
jgi:hypothetical protein